MAMERVITRSHIHNAYANIELLHRPALRVGPVVIGRVYRT